MSPPARAGARRCRGPIVVEQDFQRGRACRRRCAPRCRDRPWHAQAAVVPHEGRLGRRPINDHHRLHRSPPSTDSRRNPSSSPTTRAKAATWPQVGKHLAPHRHHGVILRARARTRHGSADWSSPVGHFAALRRRDGKKEQLLASVACPASLLLDNEQQRVAVAVVERFAELLTLARRLALRETSYGCGSRTPRPPW